MSKKTKPKKISASLLCGLVDGSSVFINREFSQKHANLDVAEMISVEKWIETRDGAIVRPSQIVSIKQITWSEE